MLTPEEDRRLREIERRSADDDPEFAAFMAGREPPGRVSGSDWPRRWWVCMVIAAVLASGVVAVRVGWLKGFVLLLFVVAAAMFSSFAARGGPPR